MYRVAASDGVALQQMVKQAGQCGQFAPDGRPGQTALLKLSTPS